jgi:hypothetical protein
VVLYSVELRSHFFAFASAKIVVFFITTKRNGSFLNVNYSNLIISTLGIQQTSTLTPEKEITLPIVTAL